MKRITFVSRKAFGCLALFLMVTLVACCRESANKKNDLDTCLETSLRGYIPIIYGGKPIGNVPELPTYEPLSPSGWIDSIQLRLDTQKPIELLFITYKDADSFFWLYSEGEESQSVHLINAGEVKEFRFPRKTKLIEHANIVYAVIPDSDTKEISIQEFNHEKLEFEVIVRSTGVFAKEIYDVEIDADHLFWLLIYEKDKTFGYQLFSFNLYAGESQLFEVQDGWVQEVETDINGNLFILLYRGGNNEIYLVTKSGLNWQGSYNISVPPAIWAPSHLFISDNNQLWLSDALWFPKAGYTSDKRIIIRSPIFVREDVRYSIVWEHPIPQAVSDDGRVWFRSDQGVTWFQPETGQWCMFSTAQSNIVKDRTGNLWLIYNDTLFMLPANETKQIYKEDDR